MLLYSSEHGVLPSRCSKSKSVENCALDFLISDEIYNPSSKLTNTTGTSLCQRRSQRPDTAPGLRLAGQALRVESCTCAPRMAFVLKQMSFSVGMSACILPLLVPREQERHGGKPRPLRTTASWGQALPARRAGPSGC